MRTKLRFLEPLLVIGIAFSIGIATLLVIIGQDKAISLLIGLATTTITLVIDLVSRHTESEKRIVQIFSLGDGLIQANDIWLYELTKEIIDDYHTVKKLNFPIFEGKMEAAL